MAASKQFVRDEVLRLAMNLFWEQGYAATGMRDLVQAMGINASSLYHEFKSKYLLFLEVLDLYRDDVISKNLAIFHTKQSNLDTLRFFFRQMAEKLCNGSETRACLMCNTAIEFGMSKPEVAKRVGDHIQRMERSFRNVLEKASQNGELSKDVDIYALATYFAGVAQGLFVIGKATQDKQKLSMMVETSFQLLQRDKANEAELKTASKTILAR